MKSQHYIGPAVFNELAHTWDKLIETSMTNTPFQRLAYQQSWWNNLGYGTLHTITTSDDKKNLTGIAPIYQVGQTLFLNGHIEESDYLDLICSADNAPEVWAAVFDCLCNDASLNWDCIDLCNIPADSPTHDILPRLAQSRGFSFNTEVNEVCPIITLPGTFEDYLANLDKKQRHEVRRKIRRANEAGLEIRVIGPDDDLETAVNQFLDLLQKSTSEKAEWLNPGRTALFHEIATSSQAAKTLQLMFAIIDGQMAAALFNFIDNGRVWVYNSGFDPDAFSHLSAGVVLTAKAIEMAIENDRSTFDFLRGNETYKYRFGAADTTIHRITIGR
ncbi:MAG: GNAT family N-acetyltransferase [Anaerolineae bacterium]|nr:GNAT family N-acetyltransferase [Anaerolineae bacterium]